MDDHTLDNAPKRNAIKAALCSMSAVEMARSIASGSIKAIDLVETHIRRIEAVNDKLNAVVVKRYDAARGEAREIDRRRAAGETMGALAGVPVTVKECFDFAGLPSTFGLESRKASKAEADELHVARLRQAGAIVLGKTNVSQLLMFVETDNPVYGRTNNPWNIERTCGGSSGGESAIIAVGGSALGIGTDIGGSCRYPAAFCGLASIKPTAGRCPDPGRYSMSVGQRAITSQIGVLARSTEDVAVGLSVIDQGVSPGNHRPGDFGSIDVRSLRIGCYLEDGVLASSPAVRRAVNEAAHHLSDAGAVIVEWTPPDLARALHLASAIFTADGGRHFKALLSKGKVHPSLKPMLMLSRDREKRFLFCGRLQICSGSRCSPTRRNPSDIRPARTIGSSRKNLRNTVDVLPITWTVREVDRSILFWGPPALCRLSPTVRQKISGSLGLTPLSTTSLAIPQA